MPNVPVLESFRHCKCGGVTCTLRSLAFFRTCFASSMPLTCHGLSLSLLRALSREALAAGRILLSVKEYTVNNAVSPERFQAEFWAEVAKLVEGGNGGSSMMVAPNFMLEDFKGFQSFFNRQVDHLTPSPRRSLCPHVALCVCVCVCVCLCVYTLAASVGG